MTSLNSYPKQNDNMNKFKILLVLLAFAGRWTIVNAQNADFDMAMRKLMMAAVMTNNFYVDSVDTKKLVEDAINGMLNKLDPHSQYSTPKETKAFTEPLSGSFEGIGVQFNILEDTLVIIQPVSKGPSEKVGILAGDRIIAVNDTAIAGVKMSRDDIMKRLRGKKGTKVKLSILREGIKDAVTFIVERDKIPLTTLDAAFIIPNTHIGLVRFSSFGAKTHEEVTTAIRRLKEQGMTKLIIDLQQNGGGLLNIAAELASELLEMGDVVVYTKGRSVPPQEFRSQGRHLFDGPIVVLIDEYTASAAEILSGAIQDQDRGLVVGRRSFGKGLVQRPIDLPDGSMIRLTIAHYYTPSGRCVQKPYEMGNKEAYAKDVLNRFNSGELTNADSMKAHVPDSLQYKTCRKGRTVYGGGGIVPDYFIPLDTTYYTRLFRELSAKSYLINTNLRFMDKNRKQLTRQWTDIETFRTQFEMPDDVVEKMLEDAAQKDIKAKDEEERQLTIKQVKRTLKALVARDIWDMSEYFYIIYEDNEMVKKAIEILGKD